ncbi:MAG: 50S ribosomal protein L9, partial [Caldisericales bacterium]|nr:50S ribosomal protein L9 [Caldisericales bacterium]
AKARAEEIKQKIEEKTITISAKAGPSGTLFGSITADMISKAMKRDLNIVMDKKSVELDEPIKSTGIHTIPVKLHHEVVAELKLEIVSQSK